MSPKRQRLLLFVCCAVLVSGGVALILTNFSDHLIYFYTPSQLADKPPIAGSMLRIGGLVESGSIQPTGAQSIRFIVTDLSATLSVDYTGTLPNLFREGQGVVAQGIMQPDGTFVAHSILAKHDENYMPPEVVDALRASGRWQHEGAAP